GERVVVDVAAVDIEPEIAAGQAAPVREADFEIEERALLAHVRDSVAECFGASARAVCGGVAYERLHARRSCRADANPLRSATRSMSRRVCPSSSRASETRRRLTYSGRLMPVCSLKSRDRCRALVCATRASAPSVHAREGSAAIASCARCTAG